MTCIVGLETENGVIIAVDSGRVNASGRATTCDINKIFKKGEIVFAYSGSFKIGQLIEDYLKLPKRSKSISDIEYLRKYVLAEITAILYANDVVIRSEEGTPVIPSKFMLGYRKKLYCIDFDLHLTSSSFGMEAIGMGEDTALGALTILDKVKSDPKNRVMLAIRAAQKFYPSICEPFTYIEI